ncbi:hypothetical protein XENOCAPTIV_026227 [Xenoophorus captivus]|uniref:Uncharacterized protein n=1 Tax=Xenoophorus captivus TaxID=1517983 RepID=A0ABV0R231_9TELE
MCGVCIDVTRFLNPDLYKSWMEVRSALIILSAVWPSTVSELNHTLKENQGQTDQGQTDQINQRTSAYNYDLKQTHVGLNPLRQVRSINATIHSHVHLKAAYFQAIPSRGQSKMCFLSKTLKTFLFK